MFMCTDCHLGTELDDVIVLFRDGTCTCLRCHRRGATGRPLLPAAIRRELVLLLRPSDRP